MTDQSGRSLRLRSVAFAVLGIVLAWQVLSRSLVAYLAETSPEAALVLRSNDPVSLVNIAERKLNVERPAREAPAAGTAGPVGGSSRIPSFARYASKVARNGPDTPDANQGNAAEPADTTERVPSNAADPLVREEIGALAVAAMATAGTRVDQRVPLGTTPGGEARNIHVGGGRYVSLLGSSPFFHSRDDRWPAAVDIPALARFARAFSDLAVTLAG